MRLIIVGGNGFIGKHLVDCALTAGHEVVAVDLGDRGSLPESIEYLAGGIDELCERSDLLEWASAVCHLASATIPASSAQHPMKEVDGNIRPTVKLLEKMIECGNRRLVFLSSGGAVYGAPQECPIPESHALDPISHYGAGNVAIEKIIGSFSALQGLEAAIIRPANPYGTGQNNLGQLGVISTFLAKLRDGEPVQVYGDGSIVRDFVHVADLARLIVDCIEKGATGVYNCGGGTGSSINELIAEIEAATGRALQIERHPARPFDPKEIVLDISKARRDLRWVPQVTLREGIGEMVAEFGLLD